MKIASYPVVALMISVYDLIALKTLDAIRMG